MTAPRARIVALALVVGVAGCGGAALNRSFNDYSAIHAAVVNRQLLLNLAREANSHPPHFLQLGLINTTFQFAASANAAATASTQEGLNTVTGLGPFRLISRLWTWGVTGGVAASEQPTFNLTPLSGPQFSQGFLSVLPVEIFLTLLDQGKPIDRLLRLLAHSIEFTHPLTGQRVTMVNVPTDGDYDAWVQFLRMAAICRELNQRQLLSAVTTTVQNVVAPGPLFDAPTLDQALRAADKGLTLQEVAPGKYALSAATTATTLRLEPGGLELFTALVQQPQFRLAVPEHPSTPAPPPRQGTMTLRLRSFLTVMTLVSNEQRLFETLAARPGFLEAIPPTQRQPVLRLTWEGAKEEDLEPPVVALDYRGRTYAITDVRGQTWNREVFTVLSYIESQAALDPKHLPVQQLINVR